jgi:hypothetical protein
MFHGCGFYGLWVWLISALGDEVMNGLYVFYFIFKVLTLDV